MRQKHEANYWSVSKIILCIIVSAMMLVSCSSGENKGASSNKSSAGDTEKQYKTKNSFDGINITTYSKFHGYQSLVDRDKTGGEPAYDYSVNLMELSGKNKMKYRAFCGGRWKSNKGDGDHIFQYESKSGAAGTWAASAPTPQFWQGKEDGKPGQWFSDNVLEPEVLLADDGKWIMYSQVEVDTGKSLDIKGKTATSSADRIMLLTSEDGKQWVRKEDRGVVVDIPDPANTSLHHEEVIYVPWDSDGKCYWMYVGISVSGQFQGYYRIRSKDYTTFDFAQKEETSGLEQIGNQIGYLKEAPNGPIFVRITFTEINGRTVPGLQYSKDGLNWSFITNVLEGSSDNNKNKNCYFLGISTIDGRGALKHTGKNTWKAFYAATTCSSPVAPDIFNSEIGVGSLTIKLDD